MRVLVTGGAGFIGSTLVDALVARGDSVTVVDDLSSGDREQVDPAARLVVASITGPELADIVAEARPEVVAHLAAQVSVSSSIDDPDNDWRLNVEGTRAVAEAARDAGARRVVFASSAAVYGEPVQLPLTEDSPKDPAVPYGRSKLAAESVLAEVLRPAGIDFAALRLANVYGPRQRADGEGGVVAEFASRMVAGVPPVVFGTGEQTRDFIFVGDVVEAFVSAATFDGVLAAPGADGPAYNVSTGSATPVIAIARALAEACGYTGPIEHRPPRAGDVMESVLDASKAERVFGWRATVGVEAGLAATAAWFART
jgi:UDP-glucose 4-epimerase